MQLTNQNYFSEQANWEYMSVSQFKGFLECEAKQMAMLRGEHEFKPSMDMLIGKYVHAWNEGRLEAFKEEEPDIFKKDGQLKSQFLHANTVIETIKNDELMTTALSGEKEIIFTADLFGIPWKILIDSYFEKQKRFGDLKVLKSLRDKFWNKDQYENVFQYRGYYTQMAVYAEVLRLARKDDDYFEPFLVVATKEPVPDKDIISFVSEEIPLNQFISEQLNYVENHIERIKKVKAGRESPNRCGVCDYCKKTKKLTGTTHFTAYELY